MADLTDFICIQLAVVTSQRLLPLPYSSMCMFSAARATIKAHPTRHVRSSHHSLGLIWIRVYNRTATHGVESTRSSTLHARTVESMLGGSIRFECRPGGGGMADMVFGPACEDILNPRKSLSLVFLSTWNHRHNRSE